MSNHDYGFLYFEGKNINHFLLLIFYGPLCNWILIILFSPDTRKGPTGEIFHPEVDMVLVLKGKGEVNQEETKEEDTLT